MNVGGWVFLALGWGLAIGLSVFSFARILRKEK
jgi:glycerol uptake facilitator-like aquaporin